MSTIYLRNSTYYYRNRKAGIHKSLKTSNVNIAKKKKVKLDKALEGNFRGDLLSFKDIANDYLNEKEQIVKARTYERYCDMVDTLLENFKIEKLHKLNRGMIINFIEIQKKHNKAAKTIHEQLRLLKAICVYAWENEYIDELPVRKFPSIKVIPKNISTLGAYSVQEITRMKEYYLKKFPDFYDIFLAFIYTGCRRGELLSIKAEDVKLEENILRITNKKTATSAANLYRYVEIHPELKPFLIKRMKKSPFDFLFKQNNRDHFIQRIRQACVALDIPYKRLHGLRHTFISNMLNNGVPLRLVMEMVGHTKPETTMRYSHVSQNDLRGRLKTGISY